jgi:hypothetical protein
MQAHKYHWYEDDSVYLASVLLVIISFVVFLGCV